MKEIALTQGKVALVDDEDYAWLSQWKWFAWTEKKVWYAIRNILRDDGTRSTVRLHRFILDAPFGSVVDHRNGDGLDCRRQNLRFCSHIENLRNRGPQVNNKSGFKGVSQHSQCDKWTAEIWASGKKKYLGLFASPEEAARSYDVAAREIFGEFAYLNFGEDR